MSHSADHSRACAEDQTQRTTDRPVVQTSTPNRSKGNRWPEETWQEVCARFQRGETAPDLARDYGMTPSAIYHQTAARGLKKTVCMKVGVPPLREVTPDEIARTSGKRIVLRRVYCEPELIEQAIHKHVHEGWTGSRVEAELGVREGRLSVEKRRRNIRKRDFAIKPKVFETPAPLEPPPPWETIAHPAQLAPRGDWRTWLFQGGRGAGKTRAGAEWLLARMRAAPDGIFALVGATLHDVREVMIDGPAGLMNLPGAPEMKYESSRRRLSIRDGAVAYAFSAEEPRRLRGPQFDGAWADEFCAWDRPQDALDMLRLGLRRGADPRLVVTTTPRPIPALRRLRGEVSCVLTQAPSVANAANLSPRFLEGLIELYRDTDVERQELNGDLVDGAKYGVWTPETWKKVRGRAPSSFERVVVAVDPPASTGGSACGIVVAGRRGPRGYVLADRTAQDLSPLGWAMRAVDAAREFGAHAIVAESNQGGEMVRATLAQADPPCAIDLVRARYGKRERATPITMLYAKGLITHCGAFAALEEDLMALDGDLAARLDRADALVWALTVLMFDEREGFAPGLRRL